MSNVYISKALRKDIPSDAVLLTKEDVIKMQWAMIRNWKPSTDIWPFSYGIGILTATTASTALNIAQHYRTKLKLTKYGRISMVLPTVALPSLATIYGHLSVITNSILLGQECPICIQTRAALLQVLLGVGVPTVVTPLAGFYCASIYATYDVPPARRENFKEICRLWLKMMRGLKIKLPIAIGINATLASAVTYFEASSFYKCQQIIYEREEEFRRLVNENSQSS